MNVFCLPKFARHVFVAILKREYGCLVDFDGQIFAVFVVRRRMIDVGLLARAYATVQLIEHTALNHLVQHHACSRVQHLFDGRSIRFILVLYFIRYFQLRVQLCCQRFVFVFTELLKLQTLILFNYGLKKIHLPMFIFSMYLSMSFWFGY